ncbi:hypothetical protein O181_098262 [Austropuccinia psidii MF-1]|uniref:Uncharacterized protein n=1 Tax=Austropuccinia psidii MF-1 TaxID=1389203 RepID=A0A9Q3PFC0_9BASI|nr:hypothetical protein [Austropuccinia psidii MF-1]
MDYQNSAAKYKSVLKKVKPVNEPMPQDINPPLGRPPLSRDPYNTPLSPKPPKFMVTSKITQERFELINFGPPGWLSEEERSLLMSFIVLREKEIAFSEEERIVHDLQDLNKVTIEDAGLPPHIEEFVDAFSGRACYGLSDIRGGYDERELGISTRPLTTFEIPLGMLQLTISPQGATNSVAVYQAQLTWILQEEIPENVGIFINDGGMKGPRSAYNNEALQENNLIRRFIWEYAVTLEIILFRIEEAGLTISGIKFACCVPALDIVGKVVSLNGRKISNQNIKEVQS